ncbi:hypothetical protein FACS189425_01300 [Clostridia bacterium]|nr:hypothetical protein FACS189425_01300 [Clostridia bacterium]
MKKWTKCLMLVMLILVFGVGAYAVGNITTITAYQNSNMTIEYNGEKWTPQDTNGDEFLPVIFNDRSYLPVRALANKLGIGIGYDAESETIWIDNYYDKDYDGGGAGGKPMIYLYPLEETEVAVKLGNTDILTHTYPKYSDVWRVKARTDGTLTDSNGCEYYALFWESKNKLFAGIREGFVVKGEDTIGFLEEKLAILGLNRKEANEFIVYWLPYLECNAYNYIRFESLEEQNAYMPLDILPKPDTLIRVFMEYKALDEKITVPEQELTEVVRRGFTAVEWGGLKY